MRRSESEMPSVVQFGRRRGSSKSVSPAAEDAGIFRAPDLSQIAVLSKSDWLRIRDEMKRADKDKERIQEAVKQREALHRKSREVVKLWSNTIAGQRQKKLEAKKIREQIEEEKRKRVDLEEAKYKEEKQKEAVEKAKTQLYYQTDRVKGLHGALLLTEVLKEREAQLQLRRRMKSASKELDKEYAAILKAGEDEDRRREREEAQRKKLEKASVAEALRNQMKEKQAAMEQEKLEVEREGQEIQHLQELHRWEQKQEEEAQAEQKRKLLRAHLEHLAGRDVVRAAASQRQEEEEEQRKRFLAAKQKMSKLRRDKEKELLSEAQARREGVMAKLRDALKERGDLEERKTAGAVAEQEARRCRRQQEEEERRAAALKAISAHREQMIQEKEQRENVKRQNERDALQAKKEADRIFLERQQLKARSVREEAKSVQDFNTMQVAQKNMKREQVKQEESIFEAKNTEAFAEEEERFRQYSGSIIEAAAKAQGNVFALCKAARQGTGGGPGPGFSGAGSSYMAWDRSGAQMPKFTTDKDRQIKKANEVVDVQEAKTRLGLTWG